MLGTERQPAKGAIGDEKNPSTLATTTPLKSEPYRPLIVIYINGADRQAFGYRGRAGFVENLQSAGLANGNPCACS